MVSISKVAPGKKFPCPDPGRSLISKDIIFKFYPDRATTRTRMTFIDFCLPPSSVPKLYINLSHYYFDVSRLNHASAGGSEKRVWRAGREQMRGGLRAGSAGTTSHYLILGRERKWDRHGCRDCHALYTTRKPFLLSFFIVLASSLDKQGCVRS